MIRGESFPSIQYMYFNSIQLLFCVRDIKSCSWQISLALFTSFCLTTNYCQVMGFCWENGYHGVMADDAEYAMFNPPRLLSAHTLKMSFQYDVTTIEYVLDEAAKLLDLGC